MNYTKETLYQKLEGLKGWCDADKAFAIYQMIHKYKPDVGVEIGMFEGKSAFPAALAMCELKKGKMIGLDPLCDMEQQQYDLKGKPRKRIQFDWEESVQNINNKMDQLSKDYFDFKERMLFHRMTSEEYSKMHEGNVDYLHIDGNHSYNKVKLDCQCWFPKLSKGALVCFDDLMWPTVKKAFDEVKGQLQEVHRKPNWGFYLFKS